MPRSKSVPSLPPVNDSGIVVSVHLSKELAFESQLIGFRLGYGSIQDYIIGLLERSNNDNRSSALKVAA